MIILALDTSGPVAGVAVWEDGRVRYEDMAVNKMTHSESIMPMVEDWHSSHSSIFHSIFGLYSRDTSSPFSLPSCDNQNISSYPLMSPKGQITLAPS